MRKALLLSLLFVALAGAQTASQEANNRYRRDLSIAVGKKDPAERAKAVEQFLAQKDLPEGWAEIARLELIRAAVKSDPDLAPRRAKTIAKGVAPQAKADLYNTLATALLEDGKHAKPALKAARTAAGVREAKPRHLYQETLGLALAAAGKKKQARKELEAALRSNPSASRAVTELASMAEAEGRTEDATALRAHAFLARPSPDSWQRLQKAWNGRDGLEEFLDQRYKTLFTSPVHPDGKFTGTAKRTVLAELYTGAGCPPCAAADLAFDAALEHFSRDQVAVVMYHVHVPRPDPMTNRDTKSRWDWQKGRGVPTYAIDGKATTGGGGRADSPALWRTLLDQLKPALDRDPGASLRLTARHEGESVAVRADIANLPAAREGLRLNLVLVEKELRYSGENSIRFHPMVARHIASFDLNGDAGIEHRFQLADVEVALRAHLDEFEKHDERHNPKGEFRFRVRMDRINPANLAVVAYIQHAESREVLQSAFTDAAPLRRAGE